MTGAPAYFENVRSHAAKRWDQLEKDPELAGPWHQLFKQVQSPRHVLSELLQNADDAGATMASVDIQDGDFVFTHDGEDFTEEHFTSLCRFGYSNKRALHTIGFRGVGFKSTFSLGDEVCLKTPSLSVAFRRDRFTEPVWHTRNGAATSHTEIRVAIQDDHRLHELNKNLDDWTKNPASLLFFRSIRCLTVRDQEVRWESKAAGPVADSQWMSLTSDPDRQFLLIQSNPEDFPNEALEEIRQERMVTVNEESSFPPCKIEIVLGMEGKLFVILPTGVKTTLPFACNAPFIQDPARVKIKDPETSPTNRWLLARAGKLAAKAMLEWLGQESFEVERRAKAYGLLSDVDRDDHSLEGVCATLVEEGIEAGLQEQDCILTEDGTLQPWGGAFAVPPAILDIWAADQVSAFFDNKTRPVLSRRVGSSDRSKLVRWECIDELSRDATIAALSSKHLPRPDGWIKLLRLWAYVSPEITGYQHRSKHHNLRICPVEGQEVLHAANDIVRLGKGKTLGSDEDWSFLAAHLKVLHHSWPRYLADQKRAADSKNIVALGKQVDAAIRVAEKLGLHQPSDVNVVLRRVADIFFANEECGLDDCVRLAHLAARFDVRVPDDFQFVTRDGFRRTAVDKLADDYGSRRDDFKIAKVVADPFHDLDKFANSEWFAKHALHEDYSKEFMSCSEDEWQRWLASGRSGLPTFIPLQTSNERLWGSRAKELLEHRGFDGYQRHRYVSDEYVLCDDDFAAAHWEYWRAAAKENEGFWWQLVQRLAMLPAAALKDKRTGKMLQVGTRGRGVGNRVESANGFRAGWVEKLRDLKCLQDIRGHYRQPAELFRRTPDTEVLLEIEPFVRSEFDTEATQWLLIELGVRDTPTGPERILDRLRALATIASPPIGEVVKWTTSLDNLMTRCETVDAKLIREAFSTEKLVFTEGNGWAATTEVFLTSDEDEVPGAALVHSSMRHLVIWQKVGVADRPTVDLAIKWLTNLESGQKLSHDELRRVRSLLPRYPERIWNDCEHWLNLQGEWTPTEGLTYSLTMQSLVPWKHLFKPFKLKTADLQRLPVEVCQQHPFSELRSLAQSIEDRFQDQLIGLPDPQKKPWLNALGAGLRRIDLDDQDEMRRVRELANCLAGTGWQIASGLQTIPYIDGTPAGTPRRIDVLWKDSLLYVEDRSTAKMAKAIAHELGRVFNKQEITNAIMLCYDRLPEWVLEYLEENFKLMTDEEVSSIGEKPRPPADGKLEHESTVSEEAAKDDAGGDDSSTPKESDAKQQAEDAADQQDTENGGFEDGNLDDEVDEIDTNAEEEDESTKSPRKHYKPAGPSLMERFAKARGFNKDSAEDRYYHKDGSWIERASGTSFPWEQHSASGELQQCYWDKDHCIERGPLQLGADVWELCDKHPEKYTLLLAAPDGTPVEYSGHRIRALRDNGRLTLFPANYRLVFDHDKDK